jgi:phage anti-repressor protein
MNEIIPIETGNIGGQAVNTVDARDLHCFLDVGKDFSTWIKDRIEQFGFSENQDFVCSPVSGNGNHAGLRVRIEYHLTIDMAKELAMVERNEKGKQARQYFIECERQLRNPHALPITYADALRQLANEVEQKELALAQRDKAIRTKAQIGNRREATAMATASIAVRRQHQLEDQLGNGQNYKSARSIPWIDTYFVRSKGMWSTIGKKLVLMSDDMSLPPKKIEDSKYGTVNTYHVDVIARLLGRLEADPEMLRKYRHE